MVSKPSNRRSSKAALRGPGPEWHSTFDAISEAVCLLDLKGTILRCNKAHANFVGRPPEEVVGLNCCSLIHGGSHRPSECPLAKMLKTQAHEEAEYIFNGQWIHVAVEPIFDEKGTLTGAVHILSDITERGQAEQALRETELQFRALADTTSIGILLAQGERFTYANAAAERITGYRVGELLGMNIWDTVHPDFRELVRSRAAARVIGTPDLPSRYEIKIVTKAGTERWVDLTSGAISLQGNPALVVTVADITEERRLRELQTAIYQISEATQTTGSLDELFRSIHAIIGRLMDAKNLYIALYDPVADLVSFPYYIDEESQPSAPRRGRRGLTEYILRTGKPLLATPDEFDDLIRRGEVESIGAPSIDWLGVPLIVGDKVIGVLAVQTYTEGVRYGERDKEILIFVSRQVAQAIERKQAEEALRESEERYRTLTESAQDAIFVVGRDLRFQFVNGTAAKQLERRAEEIIGKSLDEVLAPSSVEQARAANLRVLGSGLPHHLEETLTFPAGERYLDTTLTPLRDARGEVVSVLGMARDITERKRAEEALQVSERRFRDFVEHALVGVYRTTEDGRVLMANSAMARLLGFPSREALLKADLEEWAKRHGYPRSSLKEALARDGALTGHESAYTRDDGTVVHLRESAQVVRDEGGAVQYYEGTIEDMTEHRRLEEQLRQSQKMEIVGTLAGGVAHDFNNLLQSMLSHIQLLRSQSHDPEKALAVMRELEQHINRGASLTRQLLVFSRRETTKPERIDLNDAVRTTVQVLRRVVQANIALSTELAGGRLLVEADRGQLEQVLMNLTLNASDAMPEGGELIIRTGAIDSKEVWLSVEDTGQGIPEAIRERVFEPFFTTKEAGKGTGLGLSVVHGIVTSHGGRIEVESVVGRGSTFRVILPRVESGEVAAVHDVPPMAPDLALGKGERILVVEDEDGAREGLRDILISLGYDVAAVGSGEEAEKLSERQPFELLLTDLMLPGVAGPELAQKLKERWPALKVILMSGYTDDEALRRRVSGGTLRFLQKPFDMDTLAREVRAAFDERPDAEGS